MPKVEFGLVLANVDESHLGWKWTSPRISYFHREIPVNTGGGVGLIRLAANPRDFDFEQYLTPWQWRTRNEDSHCLVHSRVKVLTRKLSRLQYFEWLFVAQQFYDKVVVVSNREGAK